MNEPTCDWIITNSTATKRCGSDAMFMEPGAGPFFCWKHADDYEDVLGDVLISIPEHIKTTLAVKQNERTHL